jgi:sodium/hydrogen exchanger 10/11
MLLKISNYVFALIFLVEAVLKGIAFGSTYFRNAWNKFDFFVVTASIFDFLLEQTNFEGGAFLKVGP